MAADAHEPRFLGDVLPHDHRFGPFELAHMTGEPIRRCQEPFCKAVSLDADEV